jgi:hypothetical protein
VLFDPWIRDGKKNLDLDPYEDLRLFIRELRNSFFGLKILQFLRIWDLFYSVSGIRDGKIRIRDPG